MNEYKWAAAKARPRGYESVCGKEEGEAILENS